MSVTRGESAGPTGQIEAEVRDIADDVDLGESTIIRGRDVKIGPGVKIGRDVTIEADRISLGHRTSIADGCTLRGLGGPAEHIEVGDGFVLGHSGAVLLPVFVAGDYVTIHNHLLCNGYAPCLVGHNSWIGQNAVLNANDPLTIGNNVCLGTYASVYTHAFYGELLEGCEISHTAPVTIEDDAWIVGSYTAVSPGVTIGARSVVLPSSVVSGDVPSRRTVAGVPARDVSERVPAFRDVTPDEKVRLMRGFVDEFVGERYPRHHEAISDGYRVTPPDGTSFFVVVHDDEQQDASLPDGPGLVYSGHDRAAAVPSDVTHFDLTTKRYTKRRTEHEIAAIRFFNSYRARFVPAGNPRLVTPSSVSA